MAEKKKDTLLSRTGKKLGQWHKKYQEWGDKPLFPDKEEDLEIVVHSWGSPDKNKSEGRWVRGTLAPEEKTKISSFVDELLKIAADKAAAQLMRSPLDKLDRRTSRRHRGPKVKLKVEPPQVPSGKLVS